MVVIEWPKGEPRPARFFLTTLRRRMSKKGTSRSGASSVVHVVISFIMNS